MEEKFYKITLDLPSKTKKGKRRITGYNLVSENDDLFKRYCVLKKYCDRSDDFNDVYLDEINGRDYNIIEVVECMDCLEIDKAEYDALSSKQSRGAYTPEEVIDTVGDYICDVRDWNWSVLKCWSFNTDAADLYIDWLLTKNEKSLDEAEKILNTGLEYIAPWVEDEDEAYYGEYTRGLELKAMILSDKGEKEDALETALKILEINKEDIALSYIVVGGLYFDFELIGNIYTLIGNIDKAIEMWESSKKAIIHEFGTCTEAEPLLTLSDGAQALMDSIEQKIKNRQYNESDDLSKIISHFKEERKQQTLIRNAYDDFMIY